MKTSVSSPASSRPSFSQILLGSLLALLAINAFGGGCYGMTGAKDVPVEWLKHSPFHTYFTPSLVLFFIVGGSLLNAALMVFNRNPLARKASVIAAFILLAWVTVQVLMIGYVSWLQPTVAVAGVLIFILSFKIPKHEN